MRRAVAVALALVALPRFAEAHKIPPSEHAILQIRPDATEILYELLIPAGPAAARWRLLYDVNHDGTLSDEESQALTRGLAEMLRGNILLKLEGNVIPLEIKDAKMTSTYANDGVSGRIAAMIWLKTREIPPGVRKLEIELTPITDPLRPTLVRIEPTEATIQSITGALRVRYTDDTQGIKLQRGTHCTILLDVPKPAPH